MKHKIELKYFILITLYSIFFLIEPRILVIVFFYKLFRRGHRGVLFYILFSLALGKLAFDWQTIPESFDLHRYHDYFYMVIQSSFWTEISMHLNDLSPMRSISIILISLFNNPHMIQGIFVTLISYHLFYIINHSIENLEIDSFGRGLLFLIGFFSVYLVGMFSAIYYIVSMLLLYRGILSYEKNKYVSAVYVIMSILLHFSSILILILYLVASWFFEIGKNDKRLLSIPFILFFLSLFILMFSEPLFLSLNSNLNEGPLKTITDIIISYAFNQENIGILNGLYYLLTEYSTILFILLTILFTFHRKVESVFIDNKDLYIALVFSFFVFSIGFVIRVFSRFSLFPLLLILPTLAVILTKKRNLREFYFYTFFYLFYQITYNCYALWMVDII